MIRPIVVMALLLPATVAAQNAQVPASREGVVLTATRGSGGVSLAAGAAQPARPARSESRRRPSMVGYVGDSTVRSQVRVRFDAGFETTVPDRAEFFYAKCGCYRTLPASHPAFDRDAAGPGPGVLTDLNFRQLYMLGEYGVANRGSVFVELPVRWLKPQSFAPGTGSFSDATGVSDLRAGAKASLVSSAERQVTVQFQAGAPSGDALKGLGTDHWSIEPTLLYAEQLTDRFGIEAQFGDVIPVGGSAGVPATSPDKFSGSVLYYGIGPSYAVYRTDRVRIAPVVELVGWRVLGGFQTADVSDASGINIVNLKIGGRIVYNDQSSVYIGFGQALTDATWYDNIWRFEYRFAF